MKLLICLLVGTMAAPAAASEVRYTLDLEADALAVLVEIEGVEGRDLELELNTFGAWDDPRIDYVTELEAEPPLRERDVRATRFRFDLPSRWDGSARLAFKIPLLDRSTELGREFGLLPIRGGGLVSAIAINVLPSVLVRDEPIEADLRIVVRCPEGLVVATGWADPTSSDLEVPIDAVDQCLLFWHPDPRIAVDGEGDERVHVVQLNSSEDTTVAVAALIRSTLAACADATGVPRNGEQRAFVVGDRLHVSGGQRTDYGIRLSWNPETEDSTYRHMVVHELFHEWLPGKLQPDGPSLVWFFEGFTQYLSLWIAARAGLIDADQFADRMLELERDARGSSAYGQVVFADDSIHWRDGDGPLETLAYNGGALLAFHLDVALRARGATLAGLLGEWIRAGEGYSLARLKKALEQYRSGDLYRDWVDSPAEFPNVYDVLDELGFHAFEKEREAYVTYLGVRTEDDVVTAIDPQGPQAERDLRIGDRVLAIGPPRHRPIRIREGLVWEYDFGLTELSPWWSEQGWYADIERDGQELRIAIEPWAQHGGLEPYRSADPARAREFFVQEPASAQEPGSSSGR